MSAPAGGEQADGLEAVLAAPLAAEWFRRGGLNGERDWVTATKGQRIAYLGAAQVLAPFVAGLVRSERAHIAASVLALDVYDMPVTGRLMLDRDAVLLAVRPTGHACATCPDCIHNGNKCCGCYDGVCCQEEPTLMTTPAPVPAGSELADGLEEVLAEHGPTGRVNSREGWVGCLCGAKIPCRVITDWYGLGGGPFDPVAEDAVRAAHVAAAVRVHLAESLQAAREDVARALTGSEEIRWLIDQERGGWLYAVERLLAARLTPTGHDDGSGS